MRRPLILLIPAVLLGASASAQTPITELDVPCEAHAGAYPCEIGLRSCDDVKSDSISSLKQNLVAKIEGYYRGVDLAMDGVRDWANPLGKPYFTPVCNLSLGEINTNNPNASISPARASTSCGNPLGLNTNGLDGSAKKGERERAYQLGAWNQALLCYQAQVEQEINAGKLQVTSCGALAEEVNGFYQQAKLITTGLSTVLSGSDCPSPEGRYAGLCSTTAPSPTPSADPESSKHRIAICLLASAVSAVEAGFTQLASCEIFSRAANGYETLFSANVMEPALDTVLNGCTNSAKAASQHFLNGSPYYDPGQYMASLNTCYQTGQASMLRTLVNQYFPSSGACKAPTPASIPYETVLTQAVVTQHLAPLYQSLSCIELVPPVASATFGTPKNNYIPGFCAQAPSVSASMSNLKRCTTPGLQVPYTDPAMIAKCCKSPEYTDPILPVPSGCVDSPAEEGIMYALQQGLEAMSVADTSLSMASSMYVPTAAVNASPLPEASPETPKPEPAAGVAAPKPTITDSKPQGPANATAASQQSREPPLFQSLDRLLGNVWGK